MNQVIVLKPNERRYGNTETWTTVTDCPDTKTAQTICNNKKRGQIPGMRGHFPDYANFDCTGWYWPNTKILVITSKLQADRQINF